MNNKAAAAGKVILPMSPAKLYVPSAFSERDPAKAWAMSDDASGCCVLAPSPPINNAATRVVTPVLKPAKT